MQTAAVGEVALRRAYTRPVTVPGEDCDAGPFQCTADRIYAQVYELTFFMEISERAGPGAARVDRQPRGRLWLATGFDVETEQSFEEALRDHLGGLSVTSYSAPYAGMAYLRGPLEHSVLSLSSEPIWVCSEIDGRYRFDLLISTDTGGRSFSRSDEVATVACGAIARAIGNVAPEVHRTMPEVREQIRLEARVAHSFSAPEATWADRLASVPEGATFTKRKRDGNKTGAIRDFREGVYRGHEGRFGEVERSALLPPASIDVLEVPMWAAEWTFATVREHFGTDPLIEREPSRSIVTAAVPVSDPLMEELEASGKRIDPPVGTWIDHVRGVLLDRTEPGPEDVVEALASPSIWPDQGDWLVLACMEDGSASYGIAPFAGAAEVSNPREACAAVWRELGR